ncbi:hypothetical protein BDZ91DRAFT_34250 [Kalaharituber pfeilii]|nr:hypothetical protein BDZ91DRAFT_34250 [Kalaharituber pfeilii]
MQEITNGKGATASQSNTPPHCPSTSGPPKLKIVIPSDKELAEYIASQALIYAPSAPSSWDHRFLYPPECSEESPPAKRACITDIRAATVASPDTTNTNVNARMQEITDGKGATATQPNTPPHCPSTSSSSKLKIGIPSDKEIAEYNASEVGHEEY